MAFGKVSVSTDETAMPQEGQFKRMIGLTPIRVKAVNPTADEFEAITGRKLANEPEYVKDKELPEGGSCKQARISFIVEAINGAIEQPLLSQIDFFIQNRGFKSERTGKVQVIDEYGNSSWVTTDELKKKAIPQGPNGPLSITPNYRLAFRGEVRLVEFLRSYLGIPSSFFWDKGTNSMVLKPIELLDECVCGLDNIKDFFNGKFNELHEIVKANKDQLCRALFGVRMVNDKEYQTVYDMVIPFTSINTRRLVKDLEYKKNSGLLMNQEYFELGPNNEIVIPDLKEYAKKVWTPQFNNQQSAPADPFGTSSPAMPTMAATPLNSPSIMSANDDDMPF